jgi:uncharacterized protein YdaU (DUF1376 family)
LSTFNFHPDDYLNDPNVLVMTFEQRGMYITLLCRAWSMTVPGVLPSDEDMIRRLVGADPDEWMRNRAVIRACFDTSDGRWVQKRMVREFDSQSRRCEAASEAGRFAVQARWRKRDNTVRNTTVIPLSLSLSQEEESLEHLVPAAPWSALFEVAWGKYPHFARRSSKAESRKRWRAVPPAERPTEDEVVGAITACAATPDWTKDGGVFIPAMEVWIRKRGWDTSAGVTSKSSPTGAAAAAAFIRQAREGK